MSFFTWPAKAIWPGAICRAQKLGKLRYKQNAMDTYRLHTANTELHLIEQNHLVLLLFCVPSSPLSLFNGYCESVPGGGLQGTYRVCRGWGKHWSKDKYNLKSSCSNWGRIEGYNITQGILGEVCANCQKSSKQGVTLCLGDLGRISKRKGILENELESLCQGNGDKDWWSQEVQRCFQTKKNTDGSTLYTWSFPFQITSILRTKTMND